MKVEKTELPPDDIISISITDNGQVYDSVNLPCYQKVNINIQYVAIRLIYNI